MPKTLDDKINELPEGRRERVLRRADELYDEEMSLRKLRRALEKTQVELAEQLGVGQDAVSRYEARTDMLLSTLENYITAMGGKLVVIAEFPGRKPIKVTSLGELLD